MDSIWHTGRGSAAHHSIWQSICGSPWHTGHYHVCTLYGDLGAPTRTNNLHLRLTSHVHPCYNINLRLGCSINLHFRSHGRLPVEARLWICICGISVVLLVVWFMYRMVKRCLAFVSNSETLSRLSMVNWNGLFAECWKLYCWIAMVFYSISIGIWVSYA